jgi:hypothetical protein
VREQKQVKNRVHLDLVPVDRRRDEEVERLLGLGARVVDEQRRSDGAGWVVLLTRRGTSSASSAATSNARPGSSRSAALSQRLVT